MKRIALISLLCLDAYGYPLPGQLDVKFATVLGQVNWATNASATQGASPHVATDVFGNVITAGYFQSSVNFGNGALNSAGGLDCFISKYSSQGAVLWAKRFGDTLDDGINGVATDSGGNIIVTGYFVGVVDFGGITLTNVPNMFAPDVPDGFVAKYSPSGTLVWVKSFGGIGTETGNAVAVDATDNILMTGTLGSANVAFGGFTLSTAGGNDIVVAKLSSSGTFLWAKSWGGTGSDGSTGIAVDSSGNVVICGVWGGGTLGGASMPGGIFIAKYSGLDGTYKWANVPGAGGCSDVAVDPVSGNVVITGRLNVPLDFGTGVTSSGGVYLAAYSSVSNILWAKTFNNSIIQPVGSDAGKAVAVGTNGNIYLTGSINTAKFGSQFIGYYGYFIAGFNSSGTYILDGGAAENTSSASVGNGVALNKIGQIVTVGTFTGTLNFGAYTVSTFSVNGAPFVTQYSDSTGTVIAPRNLKISVSSI